MRRGVFVLLVVTLMVAAGCQVAPRSGASGAGTTVTVTDSVGRTVTVPSTPRRILSLNSDLSEVIVALGAQDRLVSAGLRVSTGEAWLSKIPSLRALPTPQTGAGINVEQVLSMKPDLVMSTIFGEVGYQDVLKALEPLGLPIVILSLEHVETYGDDVRIVAKALGAAEKGEELVARLTRLLDTVRTRTKDVTRRVRVYHTLADTYVVCGGGIFEDDQIKVAGGVNVAASITQFGARVSPEQIIAWDPDVIVTLAELPAETVLSDPKLAAVSAVRLKRVYTHPELGWGFATPRAIFAVMWLGATLYPERFADVDLNAEADDFYKAIYGFGYDGPSLR